MTTKEKPLPQDYHSVSPYLIVKNAAKALEFYKKIFGAGELLRMTMPDEKIVFAEIKIGDSLVLLSEEFPETGGRCPKSIGGTPVRLHVYVDDVDKVVNLAVAAGATLQSPVKDQFFGDRSAVIEDPFGHWWSVATHKENISRQEMLRRFGAMMRQLPPA